MWAQRIVDGEAGINRDAVLVAAIFYDIGYDISLDGKRIYVGKTSIYR